MGWWDDAMVGGNGGKAAPRGRWTETAGVGRAGWRKGTHRGPNACSARAARCIDGRSLIVGGAPLPLAAPPPMERNKHSASGRFGVTTSANGKSHLAIGHTSAGGTSSAPDDVTSTGSTTSARPWMTPASRRSRLLARTCLLSRTSPAIEWAYPFLVAA